MGIVGVLSRLTKTQRSPRINGYVVLGLLTLILILVPWVYIKSLSPSVAEAGWWNDHFLYRQRLPVSNGSGETKTDFQLKLELDTATLIAEEKLQSDCSDIRFTNITGNELKYWLEPNTCDSANTVVFVKVPSIPTSGADIFWYYGNPSLSSPARTSVDVARDVFVTVIDGVVGAWDMDEESWNGTAGEVIDRSGSGKHGTVTGSASTTQGIFNNAGVFNRNLSQYVTFPNSNPSNGHSVSLWFYLNSTVNQDIYGDETSFKGMGFQVISGFFNTFASPGTPPAERWSVGVVPVAAKWYQVVHVFETNSIKTYLDGELVHERTTTTLGQQNILDFRLGRGSNGSFHAGHLDGLAEELRMYSFPLDAQLISELYGTGGDRQGYVTPNLPGMELVREYDDLITLGSPATAELAPGPIAHWSFDSLEGSTVRDESGNGNNGTNNGATLLTEDQCISGKCMRFDGTDDYVVLEDSGSKLALSEYSISLWVKTNTQGVLQKILYRRGGSGGNYAFYINTDNKFYFTQQVGIVTGVGSDTIVEKNKWYQVTISWVGNQRSIYVNGVLENTDVSATSTVTTSMSTHLGKDSTTTGNWFSGTVDEVKIYPYARSAEEIKMDYLAGAASVGSSAVLGVADQSFLSDGLVGYWKMDEKSGTTVADHSGNGNTGTLTNMQESGTATGGTTTTLIDTNSSQLSATNDAYNGMVLRVTNACNGIVANTDRTISDYDGATKTITVSSTFSSSITTSCTYTILHQVSGKYGSGLKFGDADGQMPEGDGVLIEHSSSLVTPLFTASLWINTNDLVHDRVILSKTDAYNQGFMITEYSGIELHVMGNRSAKIPENLVADGNWHHVVATYDGTHAHQYLDGVLLNSMETNFVDDTAGLGFNRYKRVSSPYYGGKKDLDDIRLYNRALSPAEVRALYEYAPGPVGHWKFDEGEGATAYDSSGNENTGTIYGSPTWANGIHGGALDLDGVDDYIDVGNDATLQINQNISLMAWIKTSNKSAQSIIDKYHGGGGAYMFGTGNSQGRPTFLNYDGVSTISEFHTQTVTTGDWKHLALTIDSSTGLFEWYLDGENVETDTFTPISTWKVGEDVFIGHRNKVGSEQWFDGLMDDVKIYNYPRTAEQIKEDMMAGRPLDHESVEDPTPTKQTISFSTSNERETVIDGPGADPIAYWDFNERTGTTLTDKSGNENHGTLVNGPEWVSGKYGAGLRFDGVDDYVSIPNTTDDDFGTGPMTVSAWVRNTNSTVSMIVDNKLAGTSTAGFNLYTQANGEVCFRIANGANQSSTCSTVVINDNRWHHVLAVRDTTTGHRFLYIDGKLDNTHVLDTSSWNISSSQNIVIGSHGSTAWHTGAIDEVKIFDYALTPAQVAYEYNRGAPIAHWMMDECQGSTIHDASGNENHGTLTIGPSGTQTTVGTCDTTGSAWGNGKVGKLNSSMSFDGVDDVVIIPHNSNHTYTSSITISSWLKIDNLSQLRSIISKADPTSTNCYSTCPFDVYVFTNGRLYFRRAATGLNFFTSTTIDSLPIGNWVHVVVMDNGSDFKTYINGVEVQTETSGTYSSPTASTGDIRIGLRLDNSVRMHGQIDDVRIYNYALSADQVKTLYNNGAVSFR